MVRILETAAFITVLLSTSFQCVAQLCSFRISGHAFDNSYHTPIPSAKIFIDNVFVKVTDSNGFYAVDGPCNKVVSLVCIAPGYDTLRKLVDVNENLQIDLFFKSVSQTLDEVQVNTVRLSALHSVRPS